MGRLVTLAVSTYSWSVCPMVGKFGAWSIGHYIGWLVGPLVTWLVILPVVGMVLESVLQSISWSITMLFGCLSVCCRWLVGSRVR